MLKKSVLLRVAKSVKAQRLEEVWPVRNRDAVCLYCGVWPKDTFRKVAQEPCRTGRSTAGHAHDCLLALPSYIATVWFPNCAESSLAAQ